MPAGDLQLLAEYDFGERNEAEIRGDWIEPLLRLLGYGLGTRHQILRERELRLAPPVRMIGSSRYQIDFAPTVFGHRLWIIEAKRPAEDLFSHQHLGQAWSYATDPRIDVPFMVICDGARLGVFDLTVPEWTLPVFDHPKSELPRHFDDLANLIGAACIAETIRRRQLRHLKSALEAQIDLGALDRTIDDVKQMVADVRPQVTERRNEIRAEAHRDLSERGGAAVAAAGMWGHAQDINGPHFFNWAPIDRAVEIVRDQPPRLRIREFDDIEKATTPKDEEATRMWFPLRTLRMAAAALLSEDEGCAEHCRAIALEAAQQHANGFADDPLLAATYRLQRLLGPLGYRMGALRMPTIKAEADALVKQLEPEEWLRLDGQFGMSADDGYSREARLMPIAFQAQISDWSVAGLTKTADEIEEALSKLPKPPGLDHLQPITDPWLDSWLTGDPLAKFSLTLIGILESKAETDGIRELIAEMRLIADGDAS